MDGISGCIKILKKPDVTDLAGEKVLIDFDTGAYYMLKGAANDIWDLVKPGMTVDMLVESLLEIYDVPEEECRADTLAFLERLQNSGFIAIE